MNAPPIKIHSYECACERTALVSEDDGLPAGWERRPFRQVGPAPFNYAMSMAYLCPDCVAFEDAAAAQSKARLWKVTMVFHTDKGAVESHIIVRAENCGDVAATIQARICAGRAGELVSIIITPAPLDTSMIREKCGL